MDADVQWLTAEERTAWLRLLAVVELLPGALDSQLHRDAELTNFEYHVLAMLSESPDRTRRMSSLAAQTNATLPRLSNVVRRLESRGMVERSTPPDDLRASDVRLTETGWEKVTATAGGHVTHVRHNVIDALTPEQIAQLTTITGAILARIDPHGAAAGRPSGRAD